MDLRAAWKTIKIGVRAGMIALTLVCVWMLSAMAPALAETDGMIRVKLTRLGAPESLTMSVDCDYYLADDPDVRIKAGDTVTIAATAEGMTLRSGRKRVNLGETAKLMRSKSGNRGIRFVKPELSGRFCGDLGVTASGGIITAILNIYIENYLYGVVGYAMPPSAGIEALKAQAVAARTWALRRKAGRGDAAFDLTDAAEPVFKGYNGTSDYANVVKAVDDTRGGVLYSGNSLAHCYCCASNGGQTESAQNAFGTALDYSVVKDDSYDFESAATVRTAVVNKNLTDIQPELKAALADGLRSAVEATGISAGREDLHVEGLESVTACDSKFAAPSRLYKSLTFILRVSGLDAEGQRQTVSVPVSIPTYGGFEDWYGLSLNDEDNETVWVRETESAFEITFRRVGSGVGMSQRGAQVMAQQGKRASEILSFYYPGVEGRRLELTDATRDLRAATTAEDRKPIASARMADRTDLLGAPDINGASMATLAAGAAVEVYGVQGDWAAVSASGKYGYVPVETLESFTLVGSTVTRAEQTILGRMRRGGDLLALPVARARSLGQLPEGGEVQVLAWTDAWAMLRTAGGVKGFVPLEAVVFAAPQANDSVAEASTGNPMEWNAVEGAPSAILKDAAPLLENPDVDSKALETLKAGATVQVLAYGGDWVQVRAADGKVGCLRADNLEAHQTSDIEGGEVRKVRGRKFLYVQMDQAVMYERWTQDSPAVMTLCRGEKVQVGAYNDAWACVRADKITGFMRMEALSESKPAAPEGGAFVRVKAETTAQALRDGVEMREGLSMDTRALDQLDKGQRVRVIAYNALWALVQTDGGTGFAPVSDLSVESLTGSVTRQSCEARVIAEAKVYASAGGKGSALGKLSKGETVHVTAWNDQYACIDYHGQTGYVKLKGLERIE